MGAVAPKERKKGGCINIFLCHLNSLYLNSVRPQKQEFLEHP
jgi:hypothetical protein